MSLKQRLTAAANESPTNISDMPRLDWLRGLKTVPEQENSLLEQMRADLILGAENSGANVVGIMKDQAISMCQLMVEPAATPPGDSTP